MTAVSKLSKEKLDECKNIFDLNDTKKNGSISCGKLAVIFRKLGAYVPPDDLDQFIENKKEVKYDNFLNFFAEHYIKKITEKEIIDGLAFFDYNNDGFINASALKHALTTVGEKLTDEEAYDLLKSHTDKNGLINYTAFAGAISN